MLISAKITPEELCARADCVSLKVAERSAVIVREIILNNVFARSNEI